MGFLLFLRFQRKTPPDYTVRRGRFLTKSHPIATEDHAGQESPADGPAGQFPVRGLGIVGIPDPEGKAVAEQLVGKEDGHRRRSGEKQRDQIDGPVAPVFRFRSPEEPEDGPGVGGVDIHDIPVSVHHGAVAQGGGEGDDGSAVAGQHHQLAVKLRDAAPEEGPSVLQDLHAGAAHSQ